METILKYAQFVFHIIFSLFIIYSTYWLIGLVINWINGLTYFYMSIAVIIAGVTLFIFILTFLYFVGTFLSGLSPYRRASLIIIIPIAILFAFINGYLIYVFLNKLIIIVLGCWLLLGATIGFCFGISTKKVD